MEKVLIIKLGYSETIDPEIGRITSLGDVLRTTVILHHFKDAHVTWLVDEKALALLERNPFIHRILTYDLSSVLQLQHERFDTVINFEKVPGVCALADSINAWRRYGFRFDDQTGTAKAYDQCEQVYTLCQNLDIKKQHTESWQKILMETIGAEWKGQEYILGYQPKTSESFDIGFNHVVGSKWPTKAWPQEYWKELEGLLAPRSVTWQKGRNDIHEYIDWINTCKTLITNDSLGLHIALALRKKVIVLYGPTNSNETFLYDRGVGIYPTGYDCLPCFSPVCTQEVHCLRTIQPDQVAAAYRKLSGAPAAASARAKALRPSS